MYPLGYWLSEGVHLLYICNKLTLRHKNGVYLYSSEILKILYKIQYGVHGQRKFGNPCSVNLGFWGTLGGCVGCSLVKSVTFMCVCDCGYQKRRKQKVHVNSFLQVSCSSNESLVQQERSNCIVSSICLSVWYDWRNFALALAAPLQNFRYNFRLDCDW